MTYRPTQSRRRRPATDSSSITAYYLLC